MNINDVIDNQKKSLMISDFIKILMKLNNNEYLKFLDIIL